MAVPEYAKYKIAQEYDQDLSSINTTEKNTHFTKLSTNSFEWYLPLPDDLNYDLAIDWKEEEIFNAQEYIKNNIKGKWWEDIIGLFNGDFSEAWNKGLDADIINALVKGKFSGKLEEFFKRKKNVNKGKKGKGGGLKGGLGMQEFVTKLFNSYFAKNHITTRKPKVLNFLGIDFQSFKLSFTLIPLDKKEGEYMRDRFLRLQKLITPTRKEAGWYEFPNLFSVGIYSSIMTTSQAAVRVGSDEIKLYQRNDVAITSADLNFYGGGNFNLHNVNEPISMKLSLSFKDTVRLSKTKLQNKKDHLLFSDVSAQTYSPDSNSLVQDVSNDLLTLLESILG